MRSHDKTEHDGRHDRVATTSTAPGVDPSITREIRKDAYERGRADERSRHKRNPLLTILIALAAVFGLAVLALYIYNGGSFTETGRDLDQVTSRAGDQVETGARELADEAGEATQDLGRQVESVGESGGDQPPAGGDSPPAPSAPPRP